MSVTGPEEDEILSKEIAWEGNSSTDEFTLPGLPDGRYEVRIELDGYEEPFMRTFRLVRFPFEGNNLGITTEVFPPFEKTAAHEVVYAGRAVHPAVQLTSRTVTEYDGCMRVELILEPGEETDISLEGLSVEIPHRDEMVSLYHPVTARPRVNPADLLRAESSGRQTGCMPNALARVHGTSGAEEKRRGERTRFGALMVHEIKAYMPGADGALLSKVLDFGYGRQGCRVRNYWDAGYPLHADNGQVKSMLMQKEGEILALLCTWNPDPETVTLTLDTGRLGMTPTAATDYENCEALRLEGNRLSIDLEGHAVRLVRLE